MTNEDQKRLNDLARATAGFHLMASAISCGLVALGAPVVFAFAWNVPFRMARSILQELNMAVCVVLCAFTVASALAIDAMYSGQGPSIYWMILIFNYCLLAPTSLIMGYFCE